MTTNLCALLLESLSRRRILKSGTTAINPLAIRAGGGYLTVEWNTALFGNVKRSMYATQARSSGADIMRRNNMGKLICACKEASLEECEVCVKGKYLNPDQCIESPNWERFDSSSKPLLYGQENEFH